jgi:hypothetical protein
VLIWLGSATLAAAWFPGTALPEAADGFQVNTADRTDVLAFHHTVYQASARHAERMAWTGNVASGVAGTTSAAFKEDVRRRVNYYRALAGLPADIVFNPLLDAKCQASALMTSANNALDHFPPPTWLFYSQIGAEAAAASNLSISNHGPDAVDAYMVDDGAFNTPVGHRRWLLYPPSQEMATGDIPPSSSHPSSNSLWVIGNPGNRVAREFSAWPNEGYIPQVLVPARWSLSHPDAWFGSAAVTMTRNGVPMPVTVVSRTDNFADNTLVWEPSGLNLPSRADTVFEITVSGISGSALPPTVTYTVTSFDPEVLGHEIRINGPTTLSSNRQSYTFNPIPQADAYELRVSKGVSSAWHEGAETTTGIIDQTSSAYNLAEQSMKRSGTHSFHLTFPDFQSGEQSFEINRDFVPDASTALTFFDHFRFAATGSRLSAEISGDGGSSWTEVWGRNGNGSGSSSGWDSAFNPRSVSLAAFAGKSSRLRFIFRFQGSTFLGTGSSLGVYLDDIRVTGGTELVNTRITPLAGDRTWFVLDDSTAGEPLTPGGSWFLRLRPQVGTRWFGDGPPISAIIQGAPKIEIRQPSKTKLVDGKSLRKFGTLALGRKGAAKKFVITNTGGSPLTGLAIRKSGAHKRDFIISPLTLTTLAPGQSVAIRIWFKPKARGPRNAKLAILSNDTAAGPFDIRVSGFASKK